MIAFLRGHFLAKTPGRLVVDVNGVGYDVQISLYTYEAIRNKEQGLLHTYLHLTENAQTLFGFDSLPEKDIFLQLISVSGVGASTARMMLSGMRPEELVKAIAEGNTRLLESIKGIGKKSAERLVVELRDKMGKISTLAPGSGNTVPESDADATNALISLGIGKALAEQAVKKAKAALGPAAEVELLIKTALKNL